MTPLDSLADSEKSRKKKRGSVKNDDRLAAFKKLHQETTAEWASASAERVLTVVDKITAMGGAVTFGMSRDNGAYSLTLMLGKNRKTLWFNGSADLDTELDGVCEILDQLE